MLPDDVQEHLRGARAGVVAVAAGAAAGQRQLQHAAGGLQGQHGAGRGKGIHREILSQKGLLAAL